MCSSDLGDAVDVDLEVQVRPGRVTRPADKADDGPVGDYLPDVDQDLGLVGIHGHQAVAVVKPNYYPGGDPVPIDLTLEKGQFPYRADSPEGKALHDKLLSELRDQWSAIIDN